MDADEKKFFDEIAPRWDTMEIHSLPPKINSILDRIGIRKGMDILDLGTGTGVLIPYLLERTGVTGTVTALDASEGMVAEARRKFSYICPGPVFLLKDFEKEAIEGKFDLVILYCVYPHLNEPLSTLKRLITENLKNDGKIAIAFPTDEKFINSIHKERKIESGQLPPSSALADYLRKEGLWASDLSEPGDYIVILEKKD